MIASHSIRKGRVGDLSQILTLQAGDSNRLGFLPTTAIAERLKAGDVHVALDGRSLVGYILGRPSLRYARWCRPITQLVVTPRCRRRGIATSLVLAYSDAALEDGRSAVQAWTREDLIPARMLWIELGFVTVCYRQLDTARDKDAILFRLSLTIPPCPEFTTPPPTGGQANKPITAIPIMPEPWDAEPCE